MSGTILVTGGTVLSLDRGVGNLAAADVLIENGVVREVGTALRARNAEVVDASQSIVMPGFVDAHRHAWHSLFRASPTNPADIGPHYTPDHLYAATLACLLGALEAGTTTVVDWADLAADPAFADAALQGHADAGLRTILALPRSVELATLPPNVTPARGSDDPGSWAAARAAGLRIHAHAGIEASPVAGGSLGADVTLVHCTNLGAADLDAVASSGAGVALCPAMEMTAGIGWPPLQALIDRGIRPGLGVGSELEAPGDLFAQMRAANSVQHATLFEHKLAGKGGVPNLLTTREVIRYATVDGAAAVGLGDVTGSLAPGKQADLVVLRTDRPNIAPVNDPIGAVVWGMDTSNVDWVLVGGRALVRHGELVAGVARAQELAKAAQREVAAAAGLLADAGAAQP